jgi:hypothetical protein
MEPVSDCGMESMTTPTSSVPLNFAWGTSSFKRMKMSRVPAFTSAKRSFHQASSFSCDSGGRKVAMVWSWFMHCACSAARYGTSCGSSLGEKR